MSLQVFSAVPGFSRGGRAVINDDGTFTIEAPPGRYHLRSAKLPDNLGLKAIIADGVDVTETGVDFGRAGPGNLEIEVTNRVGRLTVNSTENGKPSRVKPIVLLFAQDPSRWGLGSRFVHSMRADGEGGAVFSGLPAGSYYVAAVTTELLPQELLDPDILQDLSAGSASVRITDGDPVAIRAEVRPLEY